MFLHYSRPFTQFFSIPLPSHLECCSRAIPSRPPCFWYRGRADECRAYRVSIIASPTFTRSSARRKSLAAHYTVRYSLDAKCAPCVRKDKGICNCIMASTKSVGIDEDQYRRDVLLLSSEEDEIAQQQQLTEEAKQLGLKVPEVEIVASLAASIASGMVDLSSPIVSSSSSTDRNSICETTHHHDSPQLDQLASSLSDYTISSNLARGGSTRSITSTLSTRPTSFSSSEGKLAHGGEKSSTRPSRHRSSFLSVISGSDKSDKERKRSSIKSAIGKIPFRKRRTPSTVLLPPAAQITVTKGEGGVEKLYVESKPNDTHRPTSIPPEDEEETLKLEVPAFDNDSLLRSLGNTELKQMRDAQTSEKNLHISFQNNLINELRRAQQAKLDDKLAQNRQVEDEKREKV